MMVESHAGWELSMIHNYQLSVISFQQAWGNNTQLDFNFHQNLCRFKFFYKSTAIGIQLYPQHWILVDNRQFLHEFVLPLWAMQNKNVLLPRAIQNNTYKTLQENRSTSTHLNDCTQQKTPRSTGAVFPLPLQRWSSAYNAEIRVREWLFSSSLQRPLAVFNAGR